MSSSCPAVVLDASFLIALCAKEAGRYPIAKAQAKIYVQGGYQAFAPGVLIAETLYVLCRKLQDSFLSVQEHQRAVRAFSLWATGIFPPPGGDGSLIRRAEHFRTGYGCSRSADGLYIALAEELALTRPVEIVTFDLGMDKQARGAAGVSVRVLVP